MALPTSHSQDQSDDVPTVQETIRGYAVDLKSQLDRLPEDVNVVKAIVEGLFTENIVDDREYGCRIPIVCPN